MVSHSNIAMAFDQFNDNGSRFQMTEYTNGGDVFSYINRMNVDLSLDVPQVYREFVFDAAIQIATGLDAAHQAGLVHGAFDLSKVKIQNCRGHLVFKITDFRPGSSMLANLNSEASYWPFSRNKKVLT